MNRQRKHQIAPTQIKIIKIAIKLLGMDDGTYRELLMERYEVTSCTQLTVDQARELINELQLKGFQLRPRKAENKIRRPRRPKAKNVVHLASQAEIDKLNAVAALIAWRVENGLQLFLEKRMGIKGGRVRTAGEAYKAIEGLKKMFENGQKSYYGENWWNLRFDDEAVEEYINRHAPAEFRDLKGKVYKR